MEYTSIETIAETMPESTGCFVAIKAAIAGICSGFTVAFGWLGWLVIAWMVCMVLDYTSGSVAACKEGAWASSAAREGIFHKAGMMVVVIIAAIADGVLGMVLVNLPSLSIAYTTALLPMVLVWYIFTELGSIAENATRMGASVPSFLQKMLATGQAALEASYNEEKSLL